LLRSIRPAAGRDEPGTAARARWLLVHLPFGKPEWDLAWAPVGGAGGLPTEAFVIGSRSGLPDASSDSRQGHTLRAASAGGTGKRYVVGIGELAVGTQQQDVIVTHALGSCIAVCVWDPIAQVGGLLHFLLPESKINLARAAQQPATYADTGVPLLLQEALS